MGEVGKSLLNGYRVAILGDENSLGRPGDGYTEF